MTIKELYEKCKEEINDGKGDNEIILCVGDDTFYSLEAGFSSPVYNDNDVYELIDELGLEEDNVSVLN